MKRLRAELATAKSAEQKEENAAPVKAAPKAADTAASNSAKGDATNADKGARTRNERLASISNDLQLLQARDRVNAVKTQLQFVDKEIEERKAEQGKILKETAHIRPGYKSFPFGSRRWLKSRGIMKWRRPITSHSSTKDFPRGWRPLWNTGKNRNVLR